MDKKLPKEIEGFINKIKDKFNPEQIILFGSRAKGNDWKRSDYDFIIVSSKFKGMHWLNRIAEVIDSWNLLDVLPYTPEEFKDKKKNSSIVRNALKNCVVIAG